MTPGRPRVVFDCNTYIQAVAFAEGPAARCLTLAEAGEFELLVSKATLAELRRVLTYKDVQAISKNLTDIRIAAFLQRLTFRATFIRRIGHVMNYPRDPRDEPYIDLAATAHADYLVTSDKDLLSLMTGYSAICKTFRRRTHPLRVLDPIAFLKAIDHPEKYSNKR
jgi:putative PIN family toxin of toxin-antitoxin system